MKNAGNKRLILILLALVILLCSGMAFGNTFASQVSKEGKEEHLSAADEAYEVFVKYHDGSGYNVTLSNDTPVLTDDIIWCPGYTKIVYFQLSSNEAFPVECTLKMTAADSELNKVLTYAVLGELKPQDSNHPQSWKEVAAEKVQLTTKPVTILKEVTLTGANDLKYCAVAIHMDENAGNQYLNKSVNIDFQLVINADYRPDGSLT